MHRTHLLTGLVIIIFSFNCNAIRTMYVDNFSSILGDDSAENSLLSYAQSNEIEALLLYELHIVNAEYDLSNPATNFILADFIWKSKTDYGILSVGAVAENGDFFTIVIHAYNESRTDANEKFDVYNLEFEFWNPDLTDPGEYYCTTYLTPNNLPCTNDGAFQFFVSTLQTMNNLAQNSSHPVTIEAYVGWPTATQADTIGMNLDRLHLHAYVSDPNSAYSYTENRLLDFANTHPDMDVSIIFSSEPTFMQEWLTNNSMIAAENIYTDDWTNSTSDWENNINLTGFTYFAYTTNTEIALSTNNVVARDMAEVYPNPAQSIFTVSNVDDLKMIRLYNNMGQLILETNNKQADLTELGQGVYLLLILSDNGVEAHRVIKK